ncbi:MAG: transposase [bacterium]
MTQRYEDPAHARFFTFGCYRRKHLFLVDSLAELFIQHLDQWRMQNAIRLLAFVVMPNHVHMLVHSDQTTLGKQLGMLKGRFGRNALPRIEETNASLFSSLEVRDHGTMMHRFWQTGGGYDRNVFNDDAVRKMMEYIHNNPVRAGMVIVPEEYLWSSARFWLTGVSDLLEMDRLEGVL